MPSYLLASSDHKVTGEWRAIPPLKRSILPPDMQVPGYTILIPHPKETQVVLSISFYPSILTALEFSMFSLREQRLGTPILVSFLFSTWTLGCLCLGSHRALSSGPPVPLYRRADSFHSGKPDAETRSKSSFSVSHFLQLPFPLGA